MKIKVKTLTLRLPLSIRKSTFENKQFALCMDSKKYKSILSLELHRHRTSSIQKKSVYRTSSTKRKVRNN